VDAGLPATTFVERSSRPSPGPTYQGLRLALVKLGDETGWLLSELGLRKPLPSHAPTRFTLT